MAHLRVKIQISNTTRGLLTQLNFHGVLSSFKIYPMRVEDNNLTSRGENLFPPRPQRTSRKLSFGSFAMANGEILE